MGKSSPKPPTPPDPAATAAAQTGINKEAVRESALVNQINQTTPFGSTRFTGTVGAPDRTQIITLDPQSQALLNQQRGIAGNLTDFASRFAPRVANSLASPFNTANLGQAPVADPAERQRIEANLFARQEPLFDRDEDRLRNRLANQGIAQGSEAFGSEFDDFNRFKADARLAATNAAGNEFARDFGLQSQAHNQRIADALLNRTQGLNEVSALLQGSPAIGQPNFPQNQAFGVQPADFQGAQALQFAGQQNAFNQQLGAQNSRFGALSGLGGALGGGFLASNPFGFGA